MPVPTLGCAGLAGEYRRERLGDEQAAIDTWRQVAARLGPEPPAAPPIDAMTEEEWKILDPKQDWE